MMNNPLPNAHQTGVRLRRRTDSSPWTRSSIWFGLVAAFLGIALAACSSSPSGDPGTAADAGASASHSGAVLNVGDQDQLLETLFQASGVEKSAPYQINFVQFASGPLVDSGFAAHRIDVGFMGDLPAALAVQAGLPVKAVAVEEGMGADEFLIAKPGIKSIAQLKGKTVAYTTGTAEQAFALRALATAGLDQADVQQVNVTLQQLDTVLETGQVDASVITGVQEEKLYIQQNPTAKVLASDTTVDPPSYAYEVATTAALDSPAKYAEIKDFIKRLIEASNWAEAHKSQYATDYLVDVEHETESEAQLGVNGGLIEDFQPITEQVESALQQVVSLEVSAGAIKQSFNVSALFDAEVSSSYNKLLSGIHQSD
jgi:sulfonate transport system substrate-binding protein